MKNNLSYISGLQIDIELMMYGYVGFRMSQIDEGIMTEWIAVADGGEVFADEATFICRSFT